MEISEDDRLSLVSPVGYSASTCGYCSPSGSGLRSKEKTSKSYGIWANNITPETYQQLLDRGWRRSGHYIYRPDCNYQGTCCPQIAIRVPVETFRPRNDQKKAISVLRRLVREPEGSNSSTILPTISTSRKGKYSKKWDVEREWKSIEWGQGDDQLWKSEDGVEKDHIDPIQARKRIMKSIHLARAEVAQAERQRNKEERKSTYTTLSPLCSPKKRRFETTLRVANSTTEKYQLFRSYQMKIHGESESKVSSKEGFERFLCKAPLMPYTPRAVAGKKEEEEEEASAAAEGQSIDTASDSPIAYNLYHMEYRYQGRLIAVGVLDILPRSISSVYLFYDPEYSFMKLGKVSAVREMALVKEIGRKKGMQGVQYYNLGLYIHSCQKMRYKAEYQPCELLDPESCTWLPYSSIKAALDRGVRYDFLREQVPTSKIKVTRSAIEGEANGEAKDEEEGEEEDLDENLPIPPPPGIMDPTKIPPAMLAQCLFFNNGRVDLLLVSKRGERERW